MDFIFYFLSSILFIAVLGILYSFYYNKLQYFVIKINEAEANVDSYLRKKFDLINRIINIINGYVEIDDAIFDEIVKLRALKFSSFELDRKLDNAIGIIYNIKEEYLELRESSGFNKIIRSLKEIEENLTASKNYYNDNIIFYNKLIKSFPSNLVGKLNKYKEKPFFDGKDLTDNKINDFKL